MSCLIYVFPHRKLGKHRPPETGPTRVSLRAQRGKVPQQVKWDTNSASYYILLYSASGIYLLTRLISITLELRRASR